MAIVPYFLYCVGILWKHDEEEPLHNQKPTTRVLSGYNLKCIERATAVACSVWIEQQFIPVFDTFSQRCMKTQKPQASMIEVLEDFPEFISGSHVAG